MTLPTPEEIADEVDSSDVSLGGDWQWHHVVSSANLAFRAVAKELRKIIFNDRIYKKDYDKLLEQLDGEKVKQ